MTIREKSRRSARKVRASSSRAPIHWVATCRMTSAMRVSIEPRMRRLRGASLSSIASRRAARARAAGAAAGAEGGGGGRGVGNAWGGSAREGAAVAQQLGDAAGADGECVENAGQGFRGALLR